MAITHTAHRATPTGLHHPVPMALLTVLLLVVVGIATGQVVGHLLAAGIEKLLDLIALGQSG